MDSFKEHLSSRQPASEAAADASLLAAWTDAQPGDAHEFWLVSHGIVASHSHVEQALADVTYGCCAAWQFNATILHHQK